MGALNITKPFFKKNKLILILYALCILCTYPIESLVIPKVFSNFFEALKTDTSNEIFIKYFGIVFLLVGFNSVAHKLISTYDTYLIPAFNESITNIFYEKILYYYENNYTDLELGKLLTRINMLPTVLRELTTDLFNWVVPKIITVIVINGYFLYVNKILGGVSIVLLLMITYYNINAFNPCIELSNHRYKNFEEKSEYIQDRLSNLFSIYSAGNINKEIYDFKQNSKNFKLAQTDTMRCTYSIKKRNSYFSGLTLFILVVIVGILYKTKKIDNPMMISLYMIILTYVPNLNSIITFLPDYNNHMGIISNVNDFVDMIYINNKLKPPIQITNGNIEIKNLTFGYTKDKNIFNNFNLVINSNEKVALVGPSGNGKSTLIKLIMGYFPVPENTIFIDGQDINKYNLTSIRKQISFINQNTKLFNESIYYNIKYGNNINDCDIDNLYNKFNLNRIFKNLSNGLNSNVGVNGDSLSGGQKQIILLLRNYFKNNKIIILDEPTSALDEETRKIVLELITDISKNSTLVIITHDLNNLELVKRTIKLFNGQIIN